MKNNLILEKNQKIGYHSTSYYSLAKILLKGKFKCSSVENDDNDKDINDGYTYFISTHDSKSNTVAGYPNIHGQNDINHSYEHILPVTLKINFEGLSKDLISNKNLKDKDDEYNKNDKYKTGHPLTDDDINNALFNTKNKQYNKRDYSSLKKKIKDVQYINKNINNNDHDIEWNPNLDQDALKSALADIERGILSANSEDNELNEISYEGEVRILLNQQFVDINNKWIPECHILINNITIKSMYNGNTEMPSENDSKINILKAFIIIINYIVNNKYGISYKIYNDSTKFNSLVGGFSDINNIKNCIKEYIIGNLTKDDLNNDIIKSLINKLSNILNIAIEKYDIKEIVNYFNKNKK